MDLRISDSIEYVKKLLPQVPDVAIILGSGLGTLVNEIQDKVIISYKDIPNFPVSTVQGHAGELVYGTLEGSKVLAMNGRFHYYEGYSMQDVTLPVRVMKNIGIDKLIVTNACGGLNPKFHAGGLMFITDHINFMGANPLIGKNIDAFGPRFPDIARAYSSELLNIGRSVANRLEMEMFEGVYCAITGPGYLTRAELRMLQHFGADTVGMSTVPEVMVAAHMSMKVLGIACITDMALPDELEPIDHEIVVAMAEKARPRFISLIKGILKELGGE